MWDTAPASAMSAEIMARWAGASAVVRAACPVAPKRSPDFVFSTK
ncbi:MAG: hypothetical protein B193_2325 [Solidesulfovibrio magneticus str. Maddingley MBC34]|uniref:Uncharacterized protein n=1 Tax=Solidesulfovibrio magneticus str. Maddingley MBC34 TaxID=1206767 RepID=K6H8Z9_9BACT|nr:MAG: hypothetical protein B193_2325 [Solidesulfovibrio magneticus str. Maddingley MBC34]